MPRPTPDKNEVQADFVSHCIEEMASADPKAGRAQCAAVCYNQWRQGHPKSLSAIDSDTMLYRVCQDPRLMAKELDAKDTLADSGWIEGYSAAFNNVDQGGDRILPGAFRRTLQERLPQGKVKLMLQHYAKGGSIRELIGTVTQGKEDAYGLFSHAELSRVSVAQETRVKVLEGHVDGLSIGYIPKAWEDVNENGEPVRNLKELAWLETTVTTIPMNELAVITGAKELTGQVDVIVAGAAALKGRGLSELDHGLLEGALKQLDEAAKVLQELLVKPKSQAETSLSREIALTNWAVEIRRRRLALEQLAL